MLIVLYLVLVAEYGVIGLAHALRREWGMAAVWWSYGTATIGLLMAKGGGG